MKKHIVALGIGALTLTLGITGCSAASSTAPSPSASASSSAIGAADVMFATMMIPHHQQAIQMADIIGDKTDVDPRVSALAERISQAQGPEIERMQGWLSAWGVASDADSANMGGMHHGMSGMLSEDDLARLEAAPGSEAGRLFVEQMIAHHEGAIEMARTALDGAQSVEVLELAQQVIDDQTTEIDEMRELLGTL
ncbi:DUF305 domain-containing protein [Microbacterium gorillae]|uniref:DUF305 domain-containing protein n=1 Tax=Microbacterium gorillae TaxID=1231063 RepID=UPI003D989D53